MAYHNQSFCQTGDDYLYGSEVHLSLIPFSKENTKVKKVSILNRSMCHEIGNELDTIIIHAHFLRNLETSKLKHFSKTCVFSKSKKRMKFEVFRLSILV